MKKGLKPFVSSRSKILILGTLPGDESIQEQEYYANYRNHFWKIIFGSFKETYKPMNYNYKLAFLKSRNLALWDVLAEGERFGSSDKNIINPVANNFNDFFNAYKSITFVIFNGGFADDYYKKLVSPFLLSIKQYKRLPSTSGNNTSMTIVQKTKHWGKFIVPQ